MQSDLKDQMALMDLSVLSVRKVRMASTVPLEPKGPKVQTDSTVLLGRLVRTDLMVQSAQLDLKDQMDSTDL